MSNYNTQLQTNNSDLQTILTKLNELPDKGEAILQNKTAIPSATEQVISADEGYTGLGNVTIIGDENLISENIKNGVSIFGVEGNVIEGQITYNTCTVNISTVLSQGSTTTIPSYSFYYFEVNNENNIVSKVDKNIEIPFNTTITLSNNVFLNGYFIIHLPFTTDTEELELQEITSTLSSIMSHSGSSSMCIAYDLSSVQPNSTFEFIINAEVG